MIIAKKEQPTAKKRNYKKENILENSSGGFAESTNIKLKRKNKLKNLDKDTTDGVESLYAKVLQFVDAMAIEHSAFEIAAVLSSLSLSIYKSTLSENDFNQMVDAISLSRDKVKIIKQDTIQ